MHFAYFCSTIADYLSTQLRLRVTTAEKRQSKAKMGIYDKRESEYSGTHISS